MWLKSLALDTDAYVRAVAPILAKQEVREALAQTIIDELYERVDVTEVLEESLPDQAASLAPTLAASIKTTSTQLAANALGTPPVQRAWRDANRVAHAQFVYVLQGRGRVVTTA